MSDNKLKKIAMINDQTREELKIEDEKAYRIGIELLALRKTYKENQPVTMTQAFAELEIKNRIEHEIITRVEREKWEKEKPLEVRLREKKEEEEKKREEQLKHFHLTFQKVSKKNELMRKEKEISNSIKQLTKEIDIHIKEKNRKENQQKDLKINLKKIQIEYYELIKNKQKLENNKELILQLRRKEEEERAHLISITNTIAYHTRKLVIKSDNKDKLNEKLKEIGNLKSNM